jgi:hypothetical protein
VLRKREKKEKSKNSSSSLMHLLRLTRSLHKSSAIKELLRLPEISRERARRRRKRLSLQSYVSRKRKAAEKRSESYCIARLYYLN